MMHCSLLSLGCVFGFTPSPNQASLTALRALKIAQRRLRPEVRAKLLSVSSARSNGNLTPEAWRFTFMDPITRGHSRVVTVAARTSSEHPDTVEAFNSFKTENEISGAAIPPISQNKLLIDSDKALAKARSMAKLRGVHSAEYRLSQRRNGREPFWHLCFFAEGDEPVAMIQIGARTGEAELMESAVLAA
jgi:hypothetical protein